MDNTYKLLNQELGEQLRDKQLLDEVQSIGQIGGWELDVRSGDLYWTAETYRIHDTSPEEFNPTVDAGVSYFLPESKAEIERALEAAINEGIGYDLFLETYTTKGRLISVRTTCKVTVNDEGKSIKLTGIFQDISSFKRLESIFHSYKYSVDQHSLVSVTNISGKITYVNQKFCDISEYSKEELMGSDHKILNSGYHPKGFFRSMYQQLMKGDIWRGEIKNRAKSGKLYWVNTTIVPLRDENDKIYEYMSIRTDITAKKEAELALVESQRLNAMGEMASSVAHDFNNSLQAIIGNLEVAKLLANGNADVLKYLDLVEGIAFNVKDRVKSLQSFGKPKNVNENSQVSDADQLLGNCVLELKPIWKDQAQKDGTTVDVELHLTSDNALVNINASDFKNIMYNLLKNAVEAIETKGEIQITSSIKNGMYTLLIVDNGCGMPKEVLDKAFTPFFSTKSYEVGRGLGLSGVYSLIKDANGTIKILESIVGKGTKMEIMLPLSKLKKEDKFTFDVVKSNKSLHVLWVEDDRAIGENARVLLESLGHSCNWYTSAAKALDSIEKENYDLILSDIGMMEMNGLEFRTELLRREVQIPFVIASGWELSDKDFEFYQVKHAITKPFNLSDLKQVIQDAIFASN